jgi:hypothetical protein
VAPTNAHDHRHDEREQREPHVKRGEQHRRRDGGDVVAQHAEQARRGSAGRRRVVHHRAQMTDRPQEALVVQARHVRARQRRPHRALAHDAVELPPEQPSQPGLERRHHLHCQEQRDQDRERAVHRVERRPPVGSRLVDAGRELATRDDEPDRQEPGRNGQHQARGDEASGRAPQEPRERDPRREPPARAPQLPSNLRLEASLLSHGRMRNLTDAVPPGPS